MTEKQSQAIFDKALNPSERPDNSNDNDEFVGVVPQRVAIIKMSRNIQPTKEEMDAYNRTCKVKE